MMWYWYLFTFAVGFIMGFVALAVVAGGSRADQDMEILRLLRILQENGIKPGPGYVEGSELNVK